MKNTRTFMPIIAALITIALVVLLVQMYHSEEHRYTRLQDHLDRLVLAMAEDGEADVAYEIQETENALKGPWHKYKIEYYKTALKYAKKNDFANAVYAIQTGTAINNRR
jgi:hypothetical protein